MYTKFSAINNFLQGINVPYLVSLLITTRIKLNFILIMGSLDSSNFTIKSNKTKLYAHFETYNSYNSLYSKYLKFLIL